MFRIQQTILPKEYTQDFYDQEPPAPPGYLQQLFEARGISYRPALNGIAHMVAMPPEGVEANLQANWDAAKASMKAQVLARDKAAALLLTPAVGLVAGGEGAAVPAVPCASALGVASVPGVPAPDGGGPATVAAPTAREGRTAASTHVSSKDDTAVVTQRVSPMDGMTAVSQQVSSKGGKSGVSLLVSPKNGKATVSQLVGPKDGKTTVSQQVGPRDGKTAVSQQQVSAKVGKTAVSLMVSPKVGKTAGSQQVNPKKDKRATPKGAGTTVAKQQGDQLRVKEEARKEGTKAVAPHAQGSKGGVVPAVPGKSGPGSSAQANGGGVSQVPASDDAGQGPAAKAPTTLVVLQPGVSPQPLGPDGRGL